MAQFARPASDITIGTWFPTPLYGQINEPVRADDSFISCGSGSNSICDIGLSGVNAPIAGTRTLRYSYAKDAAAGNDRNLIVRLKKGATVLHTYTHNLISEVWTQQNQVISGTITGPDWQTLSVEFESGGTTGGNPSGRRDVLVSWVELEIPEGITPTVVSSSFTANAMIMRTEGGSFTIDAQINAVTGPLLTTPDNGELIIDDTPTYEFTTPIIGTGAVSFELYLDRVPTFNTGSLRFYDSSVNNAGFEYYNGSAWVAVPLTGVPFASAGAPARFTVPVPLGQGTWYRRIRAK